MKRITAPLTKETITSLRSGQEILLSGPIYTARDQAHQRLVAELSKGKQPSFDVRNKIIYYCGPTNTPPGKIIGSCGPTTASRMDRFTRLLLKHGLTAMIGKGKRSNDVVRAIRAYKAVYFVAPAGCGALLAQKVRQATIVAYQDLGPEAIRYLEVEDFPLIVGVDSAGKDIYDSK